MDVLENGPERPPIGTRTRVILGALLTAAVAAGLLYARSSPDAAPAAAPSSAPPAAATAPTSAAPRLRGQPEPEPVLVGIHVSVGAAYSLSADGRSFVLAFDLYDHDGSNPVVAAGELPRHPGFPRLAVAVLPGSARSPDSSGSPAAAEFADIAAAADDEVALDVRDPGRLYIAGEAACHDGAVPVADINLRVNGEQIGTGLPVVDGKPWSAALADTVCG